MVPSTTDEVERLLRSKMSDEMYRRLMNINNPELHKFIAWAVDLCKPNSVFINTGSPEDLDYIRRRAIEVGEEIPLKTPGHTVHFDSPYDQARAREDTAILLPNGQRLPFIRTKDRDEGLKEMYSLLDGIMKGREMLVGFYSLGPKGSPFSILAVQITDSYYVMHNENILYRTAYDEFVRQGERARFLKFIHSQGELNEMKQSKNIKQRRIYIDLLGETVYSVNTQYGGNSIGLKKLALRLTIKRAMEEGWLSEHMFIIGVEGPNGRVTYFTGAFPSYSGKTSTAMLGRLIGDDLAFLGNVNGEVRAVNPEIGVFGIIEGINPIDDPLIYEVLMKPNEVIFSNVLITEDGEVYWNGMGKPEPERGINYTGKWWRGKTDEKGNPIPPSHPNARFTVSLKAFKNLDPAYDDPNGVVVGGIIFGGRDPDTLVPVVESFNWEHGVVTIAASLESERTAAVIGKPGEREFNPMANLDFLSVDLGIYITNYLKFGEGLTKPPKIFGVNYFLRDEQGSFLNSKEDKRVWLQWMERRVHNELGAITTPIGYIPRYEDLKALFREVLNREYRLEDYTKQFAIRATKLLEKIDRIWKIYSEIPTTPRRFFEVLEEQRRRLLDAKNKYGDVIPPQKFE
ncbi:phosphoenolpyruvate carboxykinase (GTP) [Vulcanisaeta distributa]|uniref:Phosphoenolpyruvate carboxykinase [GTP] n=1 Tax=Vulcanisaeta distributa (strain DSM 14429 / JCM 11212 / NBRC 100878 / IC-017) TaxID=572478 RepID=E1QNG4_VULDI|nr:phosphoenolpyruvate carboxykinase (GTP) [Vulcanisaeta distributa]ADN50134.1 Phosphoenolpyruvate carboxykinase (GTP) [Vulcanisaeta distributa DSM 14429]